MNAPREAMIRGVAVIEELIQRPEMNFVVVTHGNLLTLILKHYDDSFGFEAWSRLSNPDIYELRITGDKGREIQHLRIRAAQRDFMRIEKANQTHLDAITHLALKLWPDHEWAELRSEFEELLASQKDRLYLAAANGTYVGFVHMSLRYDYVEGSSSSPVGYVEGIYVDETHRNQGVSRKLVEAGGAWAKSLGCKEIGSDTGSDNHASQE